MSVAGFGPETVVRGVDCRLVPDLWFVLLTVAVFGALALCARGAGKL